MKISTAAIKHSHISFGASDVPRYKPLLNNAVCSSNSPSLMNFTMGCDWSCRLRFAGADAEKKLDPLQVPVTTLQLGPTLRKHMQVFFG